MKTLLYIFGGQSTALEIAEVARLHCQDRFESVVLVVPENEHADGEATIPISELPNHVDQNSGTHRSATDYILSMSDQPVRSACMAVAKAAGLQPVNVIHPTAQISPTARIGKGVYVAAYSVVSCEAVIEDHVTINFQATVGHHSKVESHARVNPGARLGGHTRIGRRVLVGANSFVFQGKQIGDDTLIDAMTYVDRDIEAGQICSSRSLQVLKRPFFQKPEQEAPDSEAG